MPADNLKEISLLYVEDEAIIRDQLIEILQGEVASLHVADNGKKGVELYKQFRPDIVITDIRMPEMDGLEMSREIFEIDDSVPIIVSSAFNESTYLLESIKLGIHNYLLKPINLKELFSILEKVAGNLLNAKRLREKEKLLAQYKDAVDRSEIVSKTDLNGIITYANEAFCKISGYTLEELIGKPHNIIRHKDNDESIYKELWQTILSKKEWHGVIKNQAKDGSFYIVESTIFPVVNDAGKIEEFISIRKDVTQRELDSQYLQEKLQTSAQTLDEKIHFIYEYEKALKDSTLFCRTTQTGSITMASNAFIHLLGIEEEKAEGQSYLSLVDQSCQQIVDQEVRNAVRFHQTWDGMLTYRSLTGQELYCKTAFIPIMDVNNTIQEVLCFLTDETAQVRLNQEIVTTQREVISTMGAIGETRSKETGDHVKRVAEYSKLLALKCGLSEKEAEEIKMASPMHDIGKVGIPDNILNKPGKLTDEEFEVMKTHAELGYEMLKASQQSLLKTAAIISMEHHEKWDGSGYPRGLKADEIHIYGRITAIADVFDALGHDRVYKKAWPLEEILTLFKNGRGTHFDPNLVDIFHEYLDEFLAIKELFDGIKDNTV